jgi:hypothetical protein
MLKLPFSAYLSLISLENKFLRNSTYSERKDSKCKQTNFLMKADSTKSSPQGTNKKGSGRERSW